MPYLNGTVILDSFAHETSFKEKYQEARK